MFNISLFWSKLIRCPTELTAGLYQLLEDSQLRVIVFNGMNTQTADQIRRIRPVPTYCAILATGDNMIGIVQEVRDAVYIRIACGILM